MRYRFAPPVLASAPLDKRDWRWHLTSAFSQRLPKYTFTAVHTRTHRRRFQIYPLWRAFSNLCVYGERFHRLRVNGRPKGIKKFAFTRELKQTRRRRKRERHLKIWLRVSAIIFQLFKLIMLEKCVLTILGLNCAWDIRRKNWIFVIICSRRPHNCKTGHFTS